MVWWGLCVGVWVVSLSAVPRVEVVVAALVSLPCGVLAVVARTAAGNAWTFRLRWFRAAWLLPPAIVKDVIQVLSLVRPGRQGTGRFAPLAISEGDGEGSRPQGRRALSTLLVTSTPGTIVIDIEPDTGRALVHEVGPGRSQLEEAVAG
jgi:multisubunit Na+/H+ antiporter MnhE subunit